MGFGAAILIVLILVILGIIGFFISIYNGLIRLKILVDEAWSGIDVQLKRRYDLIPNLVETVKGYAKHEKSLFEKVTQLRSAAMNAQGAEEKAKAENALSNSLKTVFALAENYPELKANENFMKLQDELSMIEDEIQAARRYYNGTVRDYNTKLLVFPVNIIAGMMKFTPRPFFGATEEEKQTVKVDFSNEK